MSIRTIYLAHPIDQTAGCPLADRASRALAQAGYICYRPSRAWDATPPFPPELQHINQTIQHHCDATVAIIPAGTPTIGTTLELADAIHRHHPTVVYTDIPKGRSAAIEALPCPVVRHPGMIANQIQLHRPDRQAWWDGQGQQPGYGKPGDAGFDLYVDHHEPIEIPAGGFYNVPSRIAIQLPPKLWGMIVGRSSSWKRRLYVAPAVIDAGYRGPLYACTWNVSETTITIEPGERIAQLIPMPLIAPDIQWSRHPLDPSDRGDSGFGSTGR